MVKRVVYGIFCLVFVLSGPITLISQTDTSNPQAVNVAILDTGIKKDLLIDEDILSFRTKKRNFVVNPPSEGTDYKHTGTAAAGFIAQHFQKHQLNLFDVKVRPDQGTPEVDTVLKGLDWIHQQNKNTDSQDVHVVYLHLAFSSADPSSVHQQALHKMIKRLSAQNVSIIVPAGSSSGKIKTDDANVIPAAFDETITVGSYFIEDQRVQFAHPISNTGKPIDYVASPYSTKVRSDWLEPANYLAVARVTRRFALQQFKQQNQDYDFDSTHHNLINTKPLSINIPKDESLDGFFPRQTGSGLSEIRKTTVHYPFMKPDSDTNLSNYFPHITFVNNSGSTKQVDLKITKLNGQNKDDPIEMTDPVLLQKGKEDTSHVPIDSCEGKTVFQIRTKTPSSSDWQAYKNVTASCGSPATVNIK